MDVSVFHMNSCMEPLIPSSERFVIMELAPKGEGGVTGVNTWINAKTARLTQIVCIYHV